MFSVRNYARACRVRPGYGGGSWRVSALVEVGIASMADGIWHGDMYVGQCEAKARGVVCCV